MVAYKLRGKIYHAYWYQGKGKGRKKIWKSLETSEEKIARKKTVGLEDELIERRKGIYGELTWEVFCKEYLEWSRTNKVMDSYLKDQFTIKHFNWHFSPHTVKDLTTKILEDYKTARKDSKFKGKEIKESTINREMNTLKAMSAKAKAWGYIKEDPWIEVKKFTLDRAKPDNFVGKEATIRSACHDAYDRVLCDLGLYQGLRRGEMANLKREDVFLKERQARIVSTMGRRTKTKKERWVPLHRKTIKDLKELFKDSNEEYVLGRGGEKTGLDYLTRRFSKILKWAGEKGHLHLTRHTFGTKAARKGDLKTVMELLGHSRLTTTEIYLHTDDEAKKKVIDSL